MYVKEYCASNYLKLESFHEQEPFYYGATPLSRH